ncbi:hypothetical protein [Anaeroselena agilis]|uniref:Uncharacterized protein n=1 Tax=Anaeroselena agilis TaxID=3063788 RepID=A0ABU3NWT1_9FIRM|nr:hypothetical protein [Selenomonadales bacterium 4137-cl]
MMEFCACETCKKQGSDICEHECMTTNVCRACPNFCRYPACYEAQQNQEEANSDAR